MSRARAYGTRSETVAGTFEFRGRVFQARMQACNNPRCRRGCPTPVHGPYWWEICSDGFRRWWDYFGIGRKKPLPWAGQAEELRPVTPAAEDPDSKMNIRRRQAEAQLAAAEARRQTRAAAAEARRAADAAAAVILPKRRRRAAARSSEAGAAGPSPRRSQGTP